MQAYFTSVASRYNTAIISVPHENQSVENAGVAYFEGINDR